MQDLLLFALAALIMVLSPGPNMIYLISRSITQGKTAGIISLLGIICGFLFHILTVSLGLTAVLFAVPYAYNLLRSLGVLYLLYLAYQTITSNRKNLFTRGNELLIDKPGKLFSMGLLTNVLNPKIAIFYLSIFPQFIKLEYGSVAKQSLQLGVTQILISFTINYMIIVMAAKSAAFFSSRPGWLKVQKWFMATVLVTLALKLALTKQK